MRTLAEAVSGSPYTLTALATVLGVSRSTVSRWVWGHEPVPAGRVGPLHELLGEFEVPQVSVVRLARPKEPVSVFGWLVLHLMQGLDYPERVRLLAERAKVGPEVVHGWVKGALIPFETATEVLLLSWPMLRWEYLADDVGLPEEPEFRVRRELKRMANWVPSVDEALVHLERLRAEMVREPLVRDAKMGEYLSDEQRRALGEVPARSEFFANLKEEMAVARGRWWE